MDADKRRDLIARLFFLLTAKLKDAATAAAPGQNKAAPDDELANLANQLESVREEITISGRPPPRSYSAAADSRNAQADASGKGCILVEAV